MGSQGNNFKFDNKTAYFIWGINLKWDLFAGGLNNLKRKSYQLEIDNTQSQYRMVSDANDLEHKQAWLTLKTNQAKFKSAQTQLKMAQRYYNDQLKAYKEGTVLYIELVDALNQLTTAELQESISRANILLSRVQIERVNSLINLNSIK
jgi:outer membrane protein TolC